MEVPFPERTGWSEECAFIPSDLNLFHLLPTTLADQHMFLWRWFSIRTEPPLWYCKPRDEPEVITNPESCFIVQACGLLTTALPSSLQVLWVLMSANFPMFIAANFLQHFLKFFKWTLYFPIFSFCVSSLRVSGSVHYLVIVKQASHPLPPLPVLLPVALLPSNIT